MSDEVWRPIFGYEGQYDISNMGRIRSWVSKRPPSIKMPRRRSDGYLDVQLKVNQEPKSFLVHRLVATAFIPNPHGFPVINHKDGDKNKNTPDNLEWTNQSWNAKHAFIYLGRERPIGERSNGTKLTKAQVVELLPLLADIYRGGRRPVVRGSLSKLATLYQVRPNSLRAIWWGDTWTNVDRAAFMQKIEAYAATELGVQIEQ